MPCPVVAEAQGQYTLVETKPASSDAKVMDSTKVVYAMVDKDKLKPVASNNPPGTSLLSTLPSDLSTYSLEVFVVLGVLSILYSRIKAEKIQGVCVLLVRKSSIAFFSVNDSYSQGITSMYACMALKHHECNLE